MKKAIAAILALTVCTTVTAGPVYTFYKISNNTTTNIGSQLRMEVIDIGGNQVRFEFKNAIGVESSVTAVYFDDGTLLGIATIFESVGVEFSQGASPPNLPDRNNVTPAFSTTAGFLADSDPPVTENGVNAATEWLRIDFNLKPTKTYADTLAALALAGAPGGLRVGLHVQAINGGGSSSYVNNLVAIPVPGAVLLGALGLGIAGWAKRRLA